MKLDLTDPASIAAWRNVAPERHDQQLRTMWRLWPQFRAAIEASRGMVK